MCDNKHMLLLQPLCPLTLHPLTSHPHLFISQPIRCNYDAIMLLLQPLHSSPPPPLTLHPLTLHPLTLQPPHPPPPNPLPPHPPPFTLHPLTLLPSPSTPLPSTSSPSTPSPLIPQLIRCHPQNLRVTFYQPPSSPRESSGGGKRRGEGSRKESLASPTSTGRGSVEEEPPAERYGCRKDAMLSQVTHATPNS